MKVYCNKCLYFLEETGNCRHSSNCTYKDTPIRRVEYYTETPEKLNANNDCKNYSDDNDIKKHMLDYIRNEKLQSKDQSKPRFWQHSSGIESKNL